VKVVPPRRDGTCCANVADCGGQSLENVGGWGHVERDLRFRTPMADEIIPNSTKVLPRWPTGASVPSQPESAHALPGRTRWTCRGDTCMECPFKEMAMPSVSRSALGPHRPPNLTPTCLQPTGFVGQVLNPETWSCSTCSPYWTDEKWAGRRSLPPPTLRFTPADAMEHLHRRGYTRRSNATDNGTANATATRVDNRPTVLADLLLFGVL
jgi:hypothetical protein